MTTLITGPVRAGKSDFARRLALEQRGPVLFIATARVDPADSEFVARVERHRRERPPEWTTIESAGPPRRDLARILTDALPEATIVVDSLGTWLADLLLDIEAVAERDPEAASEQLDGYAQTLVAAIGVTRSRLILVSEEAGWGIVPATRLGRVFRDALGRLNRHAAAVAGRAYLVVAGYALDLRAGSPVDGSG
jgi:adenosylcobinamide kinase / adenosylcobinamide-phosphate guanylyltransferase